MALQVIDFIENCFCADAPVSPPTDTISDTVHNLIPLLWVDGDAKRH
jgi:hypothetical protein